MSLPAWVDDLAARARDVDGHPPFSDQALVDARAGSRELVTIGEVAAALVSDTEAELVVDPDARRLGHGTALLEAIVARSRPGLLVWAHGSLPGSSQLAERFGFEPVRRLLQLRRRSRSDGGASRNRTSEQPDFETVAERPPRSAESVRAFRGADSEAWLALNARAFASHPEQGSVSASDLDALTAEPWFDPESFLLAFDGDELVGYNWLKVAPSTGSGTEVAEVYVLGVDPDRQGTGLGRRLLEAGFDRMRELGIRTAELYVEADNAPALALYAKAGFTEHSADVQYRLTRFTSR